MMDDNSAILELITEFLVSKNLLQTAHTLQHEWGGLYPGHSFPDINNLMENFPTAIPVDPSPPSGQFMYPFQHHNHNQHLHHAHQHHNQANHVHTPPPHHGSMEDGDPTNTDEPMNEDDEGADEAEDGEVEEDGEPGENAAAKEGEAEDDSVSVDSAYSRILVEDISEIMDEIAIDEDDMAEGEIDPLANEGSPSEESESEMDDGENEEAGDEEGDYEEDGEDDDGENRVGEEEDEEDEIGEGDDQDEGDQEEDDEGEEDEDEDKQLRQHLSTHSPSPTRGVIESVTELLGQHIQSQRDEFYQEEEDNANNDSVRTEKELEDIATLTINDTNTNASHTTTTGADKTEQDNKNINITPLDTDLHTPELREYECDVTIVNYENKKSAAMFSPLISPVPHSPTPVISPGIIPSMRSPSATLLPHSRSALYKRDASSPLGKKHVQISSDSAPVSRSNSNLSQRHTTPPPSSPIGGRPRISVSTPSTPIPSSSSPLVSSPLAATAPTSPPVFTPAQVAPPPQSPRAHIPTTPTALNTHLPPSPSTPSASISPVTPPTPATPPPSYSSVVTESAPAPNGIVKSSSGSSDKGKEKATSRRQSLEGKSGDVVMRDIYDERPPFSYPVLADGTTYDCFNLKIVHVKNRTGFESTKDFPIKANTLVAGRYQILEFLDSAAFSKAIRALDLHTGNEVCMKIIKNNKDYVDQSLDEIKLLKYLNSTGDPHRYHILQLYDFFYYKEHLFIVTELLRENLYEFYKYTNENGHPPYFTIPRLQKVALQCLAALEFIHGLDIIHTDLKPENILIKSYSRCEIKIIDFGSSCFTRDHLGSYVQSRDYRAIEVILGLPYSAKIDIWSLGCILAELFTGKVLFVNRSLVTLLARVSALVGPIPQDMIAKGRFSHKFFTKYHSTLYERDEKTGQYFFLQPKRIPLKDWLKSDDEEFVDFIQTLLSLRPDDRPTATAALQHKWLRKVYPPF